MSQSDKGFDKSEDRFVGISGDRRYDIWIVKLCELAQDKPSLGPDFALACSGPPDTLRTDEIAGLDYRWYRVSGPGSETPQAGDAHELEVLNPGTYIVEVENNCGLTARDTVVVSENASPAISGWLPETADLCTGPVQLGPIAFPAIYTVGWQDLGWGGSVPRTVTAPGTYVLRVTTLSAPDCPGYDTVVVSGSSAPIKPSLGPDFTFACPGTAPDTLRTAPIPGLNTYRWFWDGDAIFGAITVAYAVTQPGTYVLEVANDCGASRDTVVVSPTAGSTGSGFTLGPDRPWCRWTDQNANSPAYPPAATNPSLTGPAGSGLSYRWWQDGAELIGQTNRSLTLTAPGTYVLEVRNSCDQTSRDTVTLTQYDQLGPFTLASSSEPRLCPGEVQAWAGPVGSFDYRWEWRKDPDYVVVIATTRQIEISQPGTYVLTATDSCGNTYRDSVTITQQVDPASLALSLPPVYDRCLQQNRPLRAPVAPGLSYAWTSEDGSLLSTQPGYTPEANLAGTLTLTLSDRCGRTATASLQIADATQQLVTSWGNAFTPNGDGINDVYPRPDLLGAGYRLQVFDRWGQQVYAGSQPWRGTDGNADAPEGSYVVRIQVPDCQGGTRELQRTVTVIR
ncbi:MAG: gliding motility-associated C-terminal domain-containing protein [Sphingobacteriia bacterium]